jgi:hypothetical protein
MFRVIAGVAVCAAGVAGAAGPGTADARSVRSGSNQRMTRTIVLDVSHVITESWQDPDDEGVMHLVSYGSSPPSGSRFVLVDEAGMYGAVVIADVDEQLDYTGAPVYYDAEARWIESPRRAQRGSVIALGPTTRRFPRARIHQGVDRERDAAAPRSATSVWLTLDVDGDLRSDLAVVREECTGDAAARMQLGYYVDCFRAWTRDDDDAGWRSVDAWHRIYEDD